MVAESAISELTNDSQPMGAPMCKSLRLLVLADRAVQYGPSWPAAWYGAGCLFADHLYTALAELVQGAEGRPFDALVIDARRLTPQVIQTIGLVRKHRGVRVCLLAIGNRGGRVAEAVAMGALVVGDDGPTPLSPLPEPVSQRIAPPQKESKKEIEESPQVDAEELEALRDFTKSTRDLMETEAPEPYHGDLQQPVLTEEELRALLGSEP